MNDTTTTTTYLCTRPRLVSELMDLGYTCKVVSHPFRPGMKAWLFPLSENLAQTVAWRYEAEGKPAPRQITRFLQEGGEKE